MGFCREQLERMRPLWDRMLHHPFLLSTRDGTIARETFGTWMAQDHLFIEAAVPFLGAMIARAPRAHRETLVAAIGALMEELELFRERAEAAGVELEGTEPAFICHAYIQYLHATAARASYPEAFTVLYVAEKAYLESWSVVRAGIERGSPWMPFVENWTSEGFRDYVGWLEAELDRLAADVGGEERSRLERYFERTLKYEIAFWELAVQGARWPGLDEPTADPVSREG